MEGLQLIATGGALPSRTVTNEDLSRTVDTSDEWIVSRTGIRMRHWCAPEESASTLAISAAKQALERSGLSPADIGCCICATLSAPDAAPSVACRVQAALALRERRPGVTVEAVIPCEEQAARWRERDRERWFSLVERCDNETMLQHHYDRGCMLRRNRYLVDHSAMLIAVYDGMLGGTMYTISYAMKRGLDVVTLDIP